MTSRAPATAAATSLAAPLAGLRGRTAQGSVLAVFARSAYLDVAGQIVALASDELDRGPLAVMLPGFRTLQPLAAGDVVRLDGGVLRAGGHAVDLRAAELWDPALPAVAPAVVTPGVVIDEVLRGAPAGSLAPLLDPSPGADASLPHHVLLEALRRGLGDVGEYLAGRAGSDDAARAAADWIAGRGPGLTPSGDDLLTGIMHALTVWPPLASRARGPDPRVVLRDAAAPRTTRISAAYLDAAARGWASEPWHALVRSLSRSPAAVRAAVRRLLRVGETSGADALTGFCWAWDRHGP